jgi:superfamily II DNA or RNA helicase
LTTNKRLPNDTQSLTAVTLPVLRPYQQQVISECYFHIRQGEKRLLIVAPTGSGKTLVSSQIVAHAASRGKRVWFVVHRDILVKQTAEKFQKFGIDCGFIKAGWQENQEARVQIASVQTMETRSWWQTVGVDVVLLDECHLVAWTNVVKQMMQTTHPCAIYIGLTATPWRLSKTEDMGDIFNALVCAPMPAELIDSGFLVKPSYYGINLSNLSQVKTDSDGEFNQSDLAIATDTPEQIAQIVKQWKLLAHGRRTIAFAVNVRHSQHICEAFTNAGVKSAHVDGTTPTKERDRIYRRLENGTILVLSSCQTLTEGFDVPSVSAPRYSRTTSGRKLSRRRTAGKNFAACGGSKTVLLCRATQSKALNVQMIGRGLRLSPNTDKNDCIVLDFVGNIRRHGFIEDIQDINLTLGRESNKGVAPIKLCPIEDGGCSTILYTFQLVCPKCGYHFEIRRLQLTLGLKQMIRPDDVERIKFYRAKLKEAFEKNYAPGWAAKIFQELYGHYPPWDWGKGAVFNFEATQAEQERFRKYLMAISSRLGKDNSWVERYFQLEFLR